MRTTRQLSITLPNDMADRRALRRGVSPEVVFAWVASRRGYSRRRHGQQGKCLFEGDVLLDRIVHTEVVAAAVDGRGAGRARADPADGTHWTTRSSTHRTHSLAPAAASGRCW